MALSGVWFALVAFCSLIWARNPASNAWQVVIICVAVGIAWVAWIRGFALVVDRGVVTYRDGFYRTTTIPLSKIVSVQLAWVGWGAFPASVRTPRLVIETCSESCHINIKPFSPRNVNTFRCLLGTGPSATTNPSTLPASPERR